MGLDKFREIQSDYAPGTVRTKILSGDIWHTNAGVEEVNRLLTPPPLVWNDAASVKILATADSPADLLMSGFPNILQPGNWLLAGLSDGHLRRRTSQVTLTLPTDLWGSEKVSQWYGVYALAGNTDTDFILKGMPWMTVKSHASQVISLGTNVTPATGIGYGFTTDELVGGKIYVLSNASKGLMRAITANNNDNGTGGTITYSGAALTLAEGDWFVILPPGTNFRLMGDIYNNSSGDLCLENLFFSRGDTPARVQGVTQVTSVTFPDLMPGAKYRLVFEAYNAAGGYPFIMRFNADAGSNYISDLFYFQNGTPGGSTNGNGVDITPASAGAGYVSATIEFETYVDNNKKVHVSGKSTYYYTTLAGAIINCVYTGASALTSVTVLCNTGYFNGRFSLQQVG